jgi:hypothetical protein
MLTVYATFCSLVEALDMQPPVMPEDGHTTRVTTGSDFTPEKESSPVQPIWDDEDTKTFYESLPDLRFPSYFASFEAYRFELPHDSCF